MKLLKHKWFYGLGRQLFLYTTFIITVLLILIGVIFAKTTSQTLHSLTIKNHKKTNVQLLLDYEKEFSSITALTQSYVANANIQNALRFSDINYLEEKYLISGLLYPNNNYAKYCIFINNDGQIYAPSKESKETSSDQALLAQCYAAVKNTYSKVILLPVFSNVNKSTTLYAIRKVHHMDINCEPGLLIIRLSDAFFNDIFTNADTEKGCTYQILDESLTPVYHYPAESENTGISEDAKQQLSQIDSGIVYEKEYTYFSSYDDLTGYRLVSAVPNHIIRASANSFIITILLILIMAVLFSMPLILLMTRHFKSPIQILSDTMSGFSMENLDHKLQILTNTELDSISLGYNQMIVNIHELLDKIQADQEQLRSNEYNLLLYQINPHFLYNTLDNIHMLARMNGDKKTVQLICSLSKLLRISLSKGNELITVADELEHIQNYMAIEQIRTNDSFLYSINADKEVFDLLIPKLILQPIVENCIKYGFAEITESGQITINIRLTETNLEFEIHNSGTPIDSQTLLILNKMPNQKLDEITNNFPQMPGGYGIANVMCRLKLRYGTLFSMYYREDHGTVCTVLLPKDAIDKAAVHI